ncbi:hypothetical protein FGO68_gene10810 [Halteria grandinella]|uniref:Glycosyl hydrolase family 31 C-terminal domain-containing protein n=1 Tax=Halteria grandinella TaxID=5974 RepID=A0A8J8NV85_HALGN|nr:hypothetical protein FGO68_gene10810 [Halteria grandinella]
MYKPLFFEFPQDAGTYQDIVNNVMIGPAIKTSVNARSLSDATTDYYFPAGTWCSLSFMKSGIFQPLSQASFTSSCSMGAICRMGPEIRRQPLMSINSWQT